MESKVEEEKFYEGKSIVPKVGNIGFKVNTDLHTQWKRQSQIAY